MIIEALAIIGLDPESIYAIDNLRKAAEILRSRYGIKLVIVPFNIWSDSISAILNSIPIIFIGGVKVFSGYAPSVEEIVNYIVKYVKNHKDKTMQEALIPAGIFENDPLAVSPTTT